jgi:hypothetical protein
MNYTARLEDEVSAGDGPSTVLEITIYSPAAWEGVERRVLTPETPGASHRSVSVLGKQAELYSAPGGTRPLNALWLVLDLGDVIVLAQANSGGPITPGGPDYSPFINNPDLLVQVMQDLRPYPQ